MSSDITRLTFDYRKQYAGVIKQQGRVNLDADENEGLDISLEHDRVTNLDVVGSCGSPDDGFRIFNPRNDASNINFDICAGTMYIGGLRYELPYAQELFKVEMSPEDLSDLDTIRAKFSENGI
ncbi:MAG: DUF6519 domain-containing protein, partial [Candidatus Hodarchaeota archaeon]